MRSEDESDFVEYVSARFATLHHAAYLLCGDGHRADDIVQSTVTAVYQHWSRARNADNVDAYVHRILVRKYIDEQRRGWARVRLMAALPERVARPAPAVEDHDELRRALNALPRTQRTVLVLRYICDLPVEQAAEILRCTPNNVKSHTTRGLAALRRSLGPQPAATRNGGPDERA